MCPNPETDVKSTRILASESIDATTVQALGDRIRSQRLGGLSSSLYSRGVVKKF
jgi:hypothetical protein